MTSYFVTLIRTPDENEEHLETTRVVYVGPDFGHARSAVTGEATGNDQSAEVQEWTKLKAGEVEKQVRSWKYELEKTEAFIAKNEIELVAIREVK